MPDAALPVLPPDSVWLLASEGETVSDVLANDALAARLGDTGRPLVRLSLDGRPPPESERWAARAVDGTNELAVVGALESVRDTHGSIGGVIYVRQGSPSRQSLPDCFDSESYAAVERLFNLSKAIGLTCLGAGETGSLRRFMLVSEMDGRLGTGAMRAHDLVTAGSAGLIKSLAREWGGVVCRAVDLAPGLAEDDAAEILWQELCDPAIEPKEVGREGVEKRMTLGLEGDETSAAEALEVSSSDVFVVSGGGRGITADCVIALCRESKAKFALLGRTVIDADRPPWAREAGSAAELRAAAIGQMSADGLQPTPVKIEAMIAPILKAVEIGETLREIERAGGEALYLPCDVSDGAAVRECVKRTRERFGRVTGLIHGAGNLADKKIEKKSAEDFNRVFRTKVRGLENLIRALPAEDLRIVCLFSSVSGFFGNAGQVDYSMANEVFDKFAHVCRGLGPAPAVKSIGWGPWDSGMVSPTLKKAYRERGISIISSEDGTSRFCREIRDGGSAQVVIGNATYPATYPRGGTSGRVFGPGSFRRVLRTSDNPFLDDHRIDSKPVLPATFALSWMIESAGHRLPGCRASVAEGFQVASGLVMDEGARFDCETVVENMASEDGVTHMEAGVFTLSDGARSKRYGCSLQMRPSFPEPVEEAPTVDWDGADALPGWDLYEGGSKPAALFMGPSLRGIRRIVANEESGIVALCRLDEVDVARQGQFRFGSFNPYVADVALQTPYTWIIANTKLGGLPTFVGRMEQFSEIGFGERFSVSAILGERSEARIVCDIRVHGVDGRLHMRLSEVQFTCSKRLRTKLLGRAAEAVA